MERFNNHDSWISMGQHQLAPLVHDADESVKAEFHLSTDDLYRVTLEGKTRIVTFEGWHGRHCLFYSGRDDWRYIIDIDNLRKVVKRVKQ